MKSSVKYVLLLILTCACLQMQAQVNIITTIAGNDTGGYRGDNGPAINAEFHSSESLCLDKYNNIYITDPGNNRIRKITASTGIITTVAGNGVAGYNGDNIAATNAMLYSPDGVMTDTAGNIYIGDTRNYRVRKVDAITGIITTIAGTGVVGDTGDGGPATNAQVYYPVGLCFDKLGNLYFADYDNYKIRKVDASGIITTFAGNGSSGYSGDNGPATNAQVNASNLYADTSNNVYLADQNNNAVRRVDAITGIITTIAGNHTPGYSGDNGPATNALLHQPTGIYIDKQQNIFIADEYNYVIRKIDALTSTITTVAGNGTSGYSGDNGPATGAEMQPTDVFLDDTGSMIIADYGNNVIRKVYYCPGNPTASYTDTGTVVRGFTYTGTTRLLDSVKWSFGDGDTSHALNPVHTYTTNGTYHVCVSVYDYCGVDSSCSNVVVSGLGVNIATARSNSAEVWPNPTSGQLTISNALLDRLTITDIVGKEVLTMTVKSDKETIDVSNLSNGLYVVQVIDAATGQRVVKKIIKK